MKSARIALVALLVVHTYFVLAAVVSHVQAATLYLEPEKKSVKTADTFEVTLKIDTEGEKPLSADAAILFDSTNLEFVELKAVPAADKFFPESFSRTDKPNKIYIGASIGYNGTAKSGKGTIATIVFRGAKASHNIVSFMCEDGKTADTNINVKKEKITDILTCSTLKDSVYDVSADGQSTPPPTSGTPTPSRSASVTPNPSTSVTPSPSISPSPSPTPTGAITPTKTITPTPSPILSRVPSLTPSPSTLPGTGVVETTVTAIGIGIVLTLISLGIKFAL